MKRSKMVDILKIHLENIIEIPEDADYEARILLGIIEGTGMLPPDTINPQLEGEYKSCMDFWSKTTYPNSIDYGKEYYVNRWDMEDIDIEQMRKDIKEFEERFKDLLEECEHESDGSTYTSNPPQFKCIKCGQFYLK